MPGKTIYPDILHVKNLPAQRRSLRTAASMVNIRKSMVDEKKYMEIRTKPMVSRKKEWNCPSFLW